MRARPQRAHSRQRAHWRAALTPRPCRVFSIAGVLEHSYRKFAVDNGWFDPDEYLRLSEQGIGAAIVRACRHGPSPPPPNPTTTLAALPASARLTSAEAATAQSLSAEPAASVTTGSPPAPSPPPPLPPPPPPSRKLPEVCKTGDGDSAYTGNSTEGGEPEWLYYMQRRGGPEEE